MHLFRNLTIITAFISQNIYATDYFGPTNLSNVETNTIKITGTADLKKVSAENITIIGPLNFEALKVTQKLKIMGPVEGINGEINYLHCMGWASLKDTKMTSLNVTGRLDGVNIEVKDQSNIVGILEAVNSKFKDITITSSLITLKNSTVESIHVQKNKDEKDPPVVMILDSSNVTGDIVFESETNGKVIVDKTSKINNPPKGGKVEQKSKNTSIFNF